MENWKNILLFLVLILGFLLRAQELLSHNFLFLIDQGRDMMAVKSIIYDHHLTLIGPYTSLQGVFQGPIWYYLLSMPTFIFKGDPWGGIVLMVVISMATVITAYFWSKKLFGTKASFFILFLFAVSPEAIAAATYSWNPHPMWLLMVLYIFSFYELIQKKSRFHLFVWPTIGLMFHFETALAIFIFLTTLIYLLIFNRSQFKQRNFFVGIVLFVLLFIPQILFDLRHDFLMTKSFFSLFNGSNQGLFVKGENQNYLNLVSDHVQLFFYNFGTSFVREGVLKYLPNLLLILFIMLTVIKSKIDLFSKEENKFVSLLVKLILIILSLTFLYPFPIRYWFLTGFQSIYIVLFGLFLSSLWKYFYGKVTILILLVIILFYSLMRLDTLYLKPVNEGGGAKIKGKIKAIDYVYSDSKGRPFNLLVFTPPVNTDAYDYLLYWYGNRKYGFIPKNEKKENFYLLIEPDPEKEWSYKGWLETVVKTGKIIETKKLQSGLIIQQRIEEKNEF